MKRAHWADLAIFAAIAEAGSFTKAARVLEVSPSALSHALAAMEARLGVRLLNRTTRSLAPTQAGEALLSSLKPALVSVEASLQALTQTRDQPNGPLRITAHTMAAHLSLAPHLGRFVAAFPDVELEIVVDDGLTDIVAARFDAGVRHEQMLEADMIAVRLGAPFQTAIVASPAYLARKAAPSSIDDIAHHSCITFRLATSGSIYRWPLQTPKGPIYKQVGASLIVNAPDLAIRAALSGAGLTCALDAAVRPHLESGDLVEVLKGFSATIPANHIYFPHRRQMTPALRAFIDVMKAGNILLTPHRLERG